MTKTEESGFTIVELMIATTVLSLILLLATVIMISIGNLYNKGVNQSNVQDASRTVVDNMAQEIELSKGRITGDTGNAAPGTNYICINSVRFTYVLGVQIGGSQKHVLWRDRPVSCSGPAILTDDIPGFADDPGGKSNGIEMIPDHARLSNMDISGVNIDATHPFGVSPFTITVRVAYGDDDLLNHPSGTDASCLGDTGQQFCAVSELATTVTTRL